MAPEKWLDVHAHFTFPMTTEQADNLLRQYHERHFITCAPRLHWNAEEIIEYNDSAGVQMSLLSYLPYPHERLSAANEFAHNVVKKYPTRFGQLAALPTDDAEACLAEIERVSAYDYPKPDGFSTTTVYNGVPLSDPRLEKVWEYLNRTHSVVHVHPDAKVAGAYGKPGPLIDVAFDTARVATDMLYQGIFRRFPNIKFIFAHCGGALPVLMGRISLLGTEPWVPNPQNLTREEIEKQLSALYVDTAATAKTGLAPAAEMVGAHHCVYGSDCGVPCSTAQTMDENKKDVVFFEKKMGLAPGTIANNTWELFPDAALRVERESATTNGVH